MAKKKKEQPNPLDKREENVERLREFIDSTSFAGDQREAFGELSVADQHPADTSDQLFLREVDYTVKQMIDTEAEEIRDARQRQADGTYGTCERCHQPIDPERLAVKPEARYCINCQREMEGATSVPPHGEVYTVETTGEEPPSQRGS